MNFEIKDARSLNDVFELIKMNIELQTMGNNVDVAFPFLIGPPGGGKTAMTFDLKNQYLEQENKKVTVISTHFPTKPLEELGGIPQFEKIKINNKEVLATIWSLADIMKAIYVESENNDLVIWLLDDMHLCGSVHLSLLYELLTERKLRDYKLPKNVAIILAGNYSNKAGARTMFSAIVNRVIFMPVYTDFDYWCENFAYKYPVHSSIISFLKNDTYSRFFHEEEQTDSPWCSPRSWTRFSTMLSYLEYKKENGLLKKNNITDNILYLAQGHLSKEAATQFLTYFKLYKSINIKEIVSNAIKFKIPDDPLNAYVIAYLLAIYYSNLDSNKRNKNLDNICYIIMQYLEHKKELGVLCLKEIINHSKITKKRLIDPIHNKIKSKNPQLWNKFMEDLTSLF